MNLNISQIKTLMLTPLSDADIKRYLPNTPIIKYEELSNFDSIEELLPKAKSSVIILAEQRESVGHWFSVFRNNNNICYFDPFGYRVDKALLFTPIYLRRGLGQKIPFLSHLLNQALDNGFIVSFNQHDYQNRDDTAISTCGRHCVNRIRFNNQSIDFRPEDYFRYMNGLAKKLNESFDAVVCRLVP